MHFYLPTCTVPGQLNHISNNKQSPRICRKQLRYTARADMDLNRPKLITKVAKGTANLGQYTRHKPTREVTRSDHSKRLSKIKAP